MLVKQFEFQFQLKSVASKYDYIDVYVEILNSRAYMF